MFEILGIYRSHRPFSSFLFLSCPASSKVSFGEWLLTDKLWQQKCYSIDIPRWFFFFPPDICHPLAEDPKK